ncbi:MAG: aldehyde dehydrogenase family protein, partial [Rhodocyclaceae bacterium]|nr:aldehyde dehydrogenase family protein [Rhodocyclaceae bacterium]
MQLRDPQLLRNQAFIAGAWTAADSGATAAVTNPATGATLASVPDMGAAETRRAIAAANAAWPAWRALTAKQRGAILRHWHDLIVANADDRPLLMTSEQGKPLAAARGEALYADTFVEWFAEEAKRV